MADHFYSVIKGEHFPHQVTKGTSTSSEIVELRVHDGDGTTKTDLLLMLDAIRAYIVRDSAPA